MCFLPIEDKMNHLMFGVGIHRFVLTTNACWMDGKRIKQ